MTRDKALKLAIRQRMADTGEPYTAARRAVLERQGDPGPTASPSAGDVTGGMTRMEGMAHAAPVPPDAPDAPDAPARPAPPVPPPAGVSRTGHDEGFPEVGNEVGWHSAAARQAGGAAAEPADAGAGDRAATSADRAQEHVQAGNQERARTTGKQED